MSLLVLKAVRDPDFVTQVCRDFPGRIIVGLDASDGMVAVEGWAEVTDGKAVDLAKRFRNDGVKLYCLYRHCP